MITYDDIRYQVKASKKLNTDFFKEFVFSVVEKFNGYKSAINGFIGILAKTYSTKSELYFTTDRTTALREWLKKSQRKLNLMEFMITKRISITIILWSTRIYKQ